MRVHIIQPVVPHYRVSFFRKLSEHGHAIKIFTSRSLQGNPNTDPSIVKAGVSIDLDFSFKGYLGGRIYKFALGDVLLDKPDVLVLCGNVRYVSNIRLILLARRRRIGVVWFGHLDSSTSGRLGSGLRRIFMKLSDAVVLYTEQERRRLVDEGAHPDKVFFTGNALEIGELSQLTVSARNEKIEAFLNQVGAAAGSKIILFVGRLTEKANVSLLLRAFALLPNSGRSILAIVGDGDYSGALREEALGLGISSRTFFLGEILDRDAIDNLFEISHLFVYPGDVGLSIIHALYYGVPSIIHNDRRRHNPEADAFTANIDGWNFDRGSAPSLADAIEVGLRDGSAPEASRMERARSARMQYNVDEMARRFIGACVFAADRARAL